MPVISAAQILQRAMDAYARCQFYQDTGEVVTVHHKGGYTSRRPFQTSFARPGNLFRFEYWEAVNNRKSGRYVIWFNGKEARSWWTIRPQKVQKFPDLTMPMAGATGVSGGSVGKAPSLLFPGFWGGNFLKPMQATSAPVREEKAGGVECYRVETYTKILKRTTLLWIGKKDFLMRKVVEENTLPSGDKYTTTTTYNPHRNTSIDWRVFETGVPR